MRGGQLMYFSYVFTRTATYFSKVLKIVNIFLGACGSIVVKALYYKSEGHRF
jgi:hypothetical protein